MCWHASTYSARSQLPSTSRLLHAETPRDLFSEIKETIKRCVHTTRARVAGRGQTARTLASNIQIVMCLDKPLLIHIAMKVPYFVQYKWEEAKTCLNIIRHQPSYYENAENMQNSWPAVHLHSSHSNARSKHMLCRPNKKSVTV